MASTSIWSVDPTTGGVEELTKLPASAEARRWVEAELERCLVLGPEILALDDHLPLLTNGGSTTTTPDQLYMDDLGRLTVVEIKNEKAGLEAVAQLLGYSEHWRVSPHSELDAAFRDIVRPGRAAEILGGAVLGLRSGTSGGDGEARAIGERLLAKRERWWANSKARTLSSFAETRWGAHALDFLGAASRMVLIAPSFGEDVIHFAELMAARMVNIELLQIESFSTSRDERLCLRCTSVNRHDEMERVWDVVRKLWRRPTIRKRFALNGWADHLNMPSFSIASNDAPSVKLWLEVSDAKEGSVCTVVPDKWYAGTERKKLRQELLQELPPGCDPGERWLIWNFELPRERKKMLDTAEKIADALHSVLVPKVPDEFR